MNRTSPHRIPSRGTLMLLAMLVLLVGATIWRASSAPAPAPTRGPAPVLASRQVEGVELRMPRSWVQLHRAEGHATWGAADRSHTVTVARTEASVLPLPGVVQSLTAAAAEQLPGLRQAGRARLLELDERSHPDDSAMLVRFRAEQAASPALDVVQVWRRDAAAGEDLVATWTSSDGRWPVAPDESIPRSVPSR